MRPIPNLYCVRRETMDDKKARLLKKYHKLVEAEKAAKEAAVKPPSMTFEESMAAFEKINSWGKNIPGTIKRRMMKEAWERSTGETIDETLFKSKKKRGREEQSATDPATSTDAAAPPAQQQKVPEAAPVADPVAKPAAAPTGAAAKTIPPPVKPKVDASLITSLLNIPAPAAAAPAPAAATGTPVKPVA